MLELLLQQAAAGSCGQPSLESHCFYFFAAASASREEELSAAFVDAAGGRAAEAAAVKAEEVVESDEAAAGAALFSDPEFDLFFDTLQLPAQPCFTAGCDVGDVDIGDCCLESDEAGLLLPELYLFEAAAAAASPTGMLVDGLDGLLDDDDDHRRPVGPTVEESSLSSSPTADSSSSPASFVAQSSPASPSPSSSSTSSSSSSSKAASKAGGGRVSKKTEANREAAYRYRLKQRLGDSELQQRCAELQSSGDKLAGRVASAEREAQFLMQMCRQVFASRRQFALAQQARD